MHVLVRQAAVILGPDPSQQLATRTAAIAALTAALAAAADDIRGHPAIALEAQHARYIASTTPDPGLTADALDLLGWLGHYDYRAGRYASARDLQQRSYDTMRQTLGEDHPATLTSASNLAETRRELGDLAGARDLHQRTYDTRRRVLGEDHPDTLASASNLAVTFHDLGDRGAAIALLSQVVRRRSPQHPSLPDERAMLERWQSAV